MEYFRVFLKAPVLEVMQCYVLNPEESNGIDPQPDRYFESGPERTDVLAVGEYFITQIRKEKTDIHELTNMAMELQKEGLWSRLKLENKLYVRQFFEDGQPVFQLWRRIHSGKT